MICALPYFCVGQSKMTDPISLATAYSRSNSKGTDNPHFLLNKGEKALYLNFNSHLLSKELKGVKGDFLLSNKLLNSKFSIFTYGYKYYRHIEMSTSLSKNIAERLSIGIILTFRNFNYLGLTKNINQLLPGVSIAYQHTKNRFVSHITWLNPCFIASKNFKSYFTENSFLSLGINLQTSRQTRILFESEWEDQKHIVGKCGFFYNYKEFDIVCGLQIPTFYPSFGLGFHKKNFRLDLSGNYIHPIGVNLSIGIGYQFRQLQ